MARSRARKALHDEEFHLRLADSVVNFLNGANAESCFSWVPEAQRQQEVRLGFDPDNIRFDTRWGNINEQDLRGRFIRCARAGWSGVDVPKRLVAAVHNRFIRQVRVWLKTDQQVVGVSETATKQIAEIRRWHQAHPHEEEKLFRRLIDHLKTREQEDLAVARSGLDQQLSRRLESVQIVTRWKVEQGRIREYPIPRLDTVERCVFYVAGLAMLNKYGLGRALKRCFFYDGPASVHFFLDVPTTKSKFCSPRHAAAYRQRVKRARDRPRTRRRPR